MHSDDVDEILWLERRRKARQRQLLRHGDCRDPDHPGCDKCEDESLLARASTETKEN